MTEDEFAALAAACDRLLRAPSTSLARLAIPALHFLNEHPSSLAQYAPLQGEPVERGFSVAPRAVLRAARGLTRSLSAASKPEVPPGTFDVVIVSHLLKEEQLQQSDDFYFGALQRYLHDQGMTSLLVLISHLSHGARATPPSEFPRVVLHGTVSPAAETDIWRQCVGAREALRRDAASSSNRLDSRLALLASNQALAASTIDNLRMHTAVADLCQAVNPRMVITTYEGTVAERLIWHAARTAERQPLCVGYQHAQILERAHAIRRPVAAPGIDCDPDVVLTLGEITHTALSSCPALQSVRFIQYGSHRRATLPELPPTQQRPRRCLVLPDADARECVTLFDFALTCARQRPDIGFTLRPHPMVDTRALLDRNPALRQLPQNVALSVDKSLAQEFAQARYCLYRGSSAAMHAVLAGLKPYYLAQPGELPVDCLFGLTDWRETVTSAEDLIQRMSRVDDSMDGTATRDAVSFCERYVTPVRPGAVNELLAMVTS